MDITPAGRPVGGTAACFLDLVRDGPPNTQKNELQPHLKQYWAIPPEHSAEFVAAMEDVLAVYQRPPDPVHPVICMEALVHKSRLGQTGACRISFYRTRCEIGFRSW